MPVMPSLILENDMTTKDLRLEYRYATGTDAINSDLSPNIFEESDIPDILSYLIWLEQKVLIQKDEINNLKIKG
jgi:hypothetical protein